MLIAHIVMIGRPTYGEKDPCVFMGCHDRAPSHGGNDFSKSEPANSYAQASTSSHPNVKVGTHSKQNAPSKNCVLSKTYKNAAEVGTSWHPNFKVGTHPNTFRLLKKNA